MILIITSSLYPRRVSVEELWSLGALSWVLLERPGWMLTVSVQLCPANGNAWWLTCVYGPQHDQNKIQFLQELRDIRAQCFGPWLVVGDFNLIYRDEDKNNANLNRAMMGRFRRWINDMELSEIPLHGRKFTWTSSFTSASPTLVRLDRMFCSLDWEEQFPL